jgi:hypothetical protein
MGNSEGQWVSLSFFTRRLSRIIFVEGFMVNLPNNLPNDNNIFFNKIASDCKRVFQQKSPGLLFYLAAPGFSVHFDEFRVERKTGFEPATLSLGS